MSTALFVCFNLALLVTAVIGGCTDKPEWARECPYIISLFGKRICKSRNFHVRKMMRNCPETCGLCTDGGNRPQSPTLPCDRTPYGCCWDGETAAKSLHQDGCPWCADYHKYICPMFKHYCTKTSGNAEYIKLSCPVTCNFCVPVKRSSLAEKRESIADIIARMMKKTRRHH